MEKSGSECNNRSLTTRVTRQAVCTTVGVKCVEIIGAKTKVLCGSRSMAKVVQKPARCIGFKGEGFVRSQNELSTPTSFFNQITLLLDRIPL